MKLIRLKLENIKSYVDETIIFYPGINFISGVNGVGKSTIIEAIGYALFDSSLYSVKQFIREGERSGLITVLLEADDERLYKVVRRLRLPSGSSWAVYDEESGAELNELHGNQDVKAWLAENLGVNKGLDPALLFEDVIGIPQGKFTAPFMERAAERRRVFNKILQLEHYRDAFEKTAGLAAVFQSRIREKEYEKDKKTIRVEDLDECRAKQKELGMLLSELQRSLSELTKRIEVKEAEIAAEENLKEDLEKTENIKKGIQIRLEGLLEQEHKVLENLAIAAQCEKKVKAAEEGFRQYQSLQKKQLELEKARQEKEELEERKHQVIKDIALLEGQLSTGRENKERRIKEAEKELEQLAQEGLQVGDVKKEADKQKAENEARLERVSMVAEEWLGLSHTIGQSRETLQILQQLEQNYCQIVHDISVEEEALQAEKEVEKLASTVSLLEDELTAVQIKHNELAGRLNFLKDNQQYVRGGLCPFLQVPCLNVEGSLEQYFTKEMNKLFPQQVYLEQSKKDRENKLEKARNAKEELGLIQYHKKQLQSLQVKGLEVKEQLDEEINKLLKMLHPCLLDKVKLLLVEERKLLEKRVVDNELEELTSEINELEREVDYYSSSYQKTNYEGQNAVKDRIYSAQLFVESLLQLQQKALITYNKLKTILQHDQEKELTRVANLTSRLEYLRERYKKVKDSLTALQKDQGLAIQEKELAEKSKGLQELILKLEQYNDIEELWDNNKKSLTQHEDAYIQYMQNKEGAARKKKYEQDREVLNKEKDENIQKLKKTEDRLCALQDKYKPKILMDLKKERDNLVLEKGQKEKEMSHSQEDAERYTILVREKEKILAEIVLIDMGINREKKAYELLRYCRSALNESGERMAHFYRQYLGREAALLYHQIAQDNVGLVWGDDYEIKIIDNNGGKERERIFSQLSGGEKMTAALTVRLSLLKQLSGIGIGFFDEPTSNLDEKRRSNLANIIPETTKDFWQTFIISHDDTFDAITENVIYLKKDAEKGTKVETI